MNLTIQNGASAQTMSSREIAELTGKQHKHVRRDIAKLLEDLGYSKDGLVHPWTDPQNGQQYEEYRIDRRLTDCLLTGYSAKARIKVIDRWHELEAKQMPAIPKTYAEALQLAANQAKQLEEQAPKVAFVENLVERGTLMTATQIGQKHGISAIKLNKLLDEIGGVYSKNVKRARTFTQAWLDNGYGELKQTQEGHSQPLFTPAGELRINEMLISEGGCMSKYTIGYVATIFYDGVATKYRYAGAGEWEFISGVNCPARYQKLLDFVR